MPLAIQPAPSQEPLPRAQPIARVDDPVPSASEREGSALVPADPPDYDPSPPSECSSRSVDLQLDAPSTCEEPVRIDCTPAVYRGSTCDAGDSSDRCIRAGEDGREEVFFALELPAEECCDIRFPWWTKTRAGYGWGPPCPGDHKSCAYGKGPRGLTGTVTRTRSEEYGTMWIMLETGAESCGAFEFTVSPCSCPTPLMSYEQDG